MVEIQSVGKTVEKGEKEKHQSCAFWKWQKGYSNKKV